MSKLRVATLAVAAADLGAFYAHSQTVRPITLGAIV